MGRHLLETNTVSKSDKAHIRGAEDFLSWPTLQMKYYTDTQKHLQKGISKITYATEV